MGRFDLSRRTVLRGMLGGSAVTMSLPILEAMLNQNGTAHADGGELPCRFVSWFFGNGVYLPAWEPAQVGSRWELSQSLTPLADVKDYVNICTGLLNRSRNKISHHEGMTAFSGYDIDPFDGPKPFNSHMAGMTLDQRIADAISDDTIVRAIHVGVDQHMSSEDGGTTLAALSHRGANEPEYPEHSPAKVWTQLFAGGDTNDKELRLGIVDAVRGDLARLQGRLGQTDKAIVDKHVEGIFELEKKIIALGDGGGGGVEGCMAPAQPTETNPLIPDQPFTEVCDLMDELIVQAFKCDITRVATNLFLYGASHFHFHMLGQGAFEHHFENSHMGPGDWRERYTAVNRYCVERIAHLAKRLHEETEGEGNLLDSTVILASSDCGPGWTHSIDRQPMLLVGHGHGALRYPGVHYQATPAADLEAGFPTSAGNTSDVLLTVLQGFDPAATQVGDTSTGDAPGSSSPLEAIRGTG